MHVKHLALLTLTLPLLAQGNRALPPEIPASAKEAYFKALARKFEAQSLLQQTPEFQLLQQTEKDLQVKSQEISAICGDKYTIQVDAEKEPLCAPKPGPPTPPVTPVEPSPKKPSKK